MSSVSRVRHFTLLCKVAKRLLSTLSLEPLVALFVLNRLVSGQSARGIGYYLSVL